MADVKTIKVTGKVVMASDDKKVEMDSPEILVIKKKANKR
jgi:hypothetical protein